MAARNRPTWIVVMDGAQARFFVLRKTDDGQIFEETAMPLNIDHQRTARATRDKPGRAYSSGGARHAVEPRSNSFKLEKHDLVREVADALDGALADRRYEQLVLVAPPRSLGELRELLPVRVREALVHEVPKSLVNLGTDALWAKLSTFLLKAARPLDGAAAPTAANAHNGDIPVSVVFRNMDASPTVQANALKYAAKLGRKFGRIVNCRVAVEAPRHAHRKVKLFHVTVDLKLPGREIASKSAGEGHRDHEDVNAALREAFAAATRQMQDHLTRIKGTSDQARRSSSLRSRRVEVA